MLRTLTALLIFVPSLACAEQTHGSSTPQVQQVVASFATVDVHDLEQLHEDADLLVLDVRTVREFSAGHMPGALNIDVGVLSGSLTQLDGYRDQPVYVSCRTSNRSRVASQILVDAGFSDVTQVLGGFSQWESSGYAVER